MKRPYLSHVYVVVCDEDVDGAAVFEDESDAEAFASAGRDRYPVECRIIWAGADAAAFLAVEVEQL